MRENQHLAEATYFLADLGSTYTKGLLVAENGEILGSHVAPTRRHDLDRGYVEARAALSKCVTGRLQDSNVLVSSSAAGGLRLMTVGLEPELTVRIGRLAAATAGGRITSALSLSEFLKLDRDAIQAISPDILLLSGGTDGGDPDALPAAARHLRSLAWRCPVVVAGNRDAYPATRVAFGTDAVVRLVDNVMPRLGEVVLEPARNAIRETFIEHVMGVGRFASASKVAARVIMPTPEAVLLATTLLGELASDVPDFVNPVVIDVGGATTDVHSFLSEGVSRAPLGGDTPGALRTVEADLGMRESARSLLDTAVDVKLLYGKDSELMAAAEARVHDRSYLPIRPEDVDVDRKLGLLASAIGIERHVGRMQIHTGIDGITVVQTGRSLRESRLVIATGGIFRHARSPERVIRSALRIAAARGALGPAPCVRVMVDHHYLLWAAGLLSTVAPYTARAMLLGAFASNRRYDVARD